MIKRTKSELLLSLLYSLKDGENIDESELEMLKNMMVQNNSDDLNVEQMIAQKDMKEKIHKWIESEIKELCIR
jgi:hypothetical protein